jgi:hypothetical protein
MENSFRNTGKMTRKRRRKTFLKLNFFNGTIERRLGLNIKEDYFKITSLAGGKINEKF